MTPLREAFDDAFALLEDAVEAGRIPGGALGVVDTEAGRLTAVTGMAALVPEPRPTTRDTWFDLASLTKVLFTTPAILAEAKSGRLDLDAPLVDLLPALRNREVTARQCLGHQTSFPADAPIHTWGTDPEKLRQMVMEHDWPEGPPVYSCINFLLLGFVLEALTGRTLREQDAGPGFAFSAPPDESAATELCAWRGRVLSGEVHDETAAALQGAGNAGLFGTLDAILDRAEDWLRDGGPIVSAMRRPLSTTRTHGWERAHPGWSGGDAAGAETIGHTGFTGTGLWIDFARGRAWTLLTNRVHPSRHADSGIFTLRPAVGECFSRR